MTGRGQTCSACEGEGTYIVGDWRQGYPKRKCAVCKGSGRMARQPDGAWGPALVDDDRARFRRDDELAKGE